AAKPDDAFPYSADGTMLPLLSSVRPSSWLAGEQCNGSVRRMPTWSGHQARNPGHPSIRYYYIEECPGFPDCASLPGAQFQPPALSRYNGAAGRRRLVRDVLIGLPNTSRAGG